MSLFDGVMLGIVLGIITWMFIDYVTGPYDWSGDDTEH